METYTMELDKILSKGMLPVVRKRDILKARTLSREEKRELERGGADILVTSPSGTQMMMKRADIIKQYTYLDGKKISMAGWSSSKEYIIAKLDNTNAFAMMVPLNCTANVNGTKANAAQRKSGDYIVCLADSSGNIDESTVGVIPAAMFKKMYYMPPNEVISRHYGSGNKTYNPNAPKQKSSVVSTRKQPINFTEQLGMNTEDFDFGVEDMYKQPEKKVQSSNMNMAKPEKESTYKYLAIGRLVNQSRETIGFVIQNKSGATKNISKGQMMELCKKRLVSNVMLGVKSDTGKAYLRGNNIRLEMLPEYLA